MAGYFVRREGVQTMNRNHMITLGIVLFGLGWKLTTIESVTLNEPTTRILADTADHTEANMFPQGTLPLKTFPIPRWLPFAMMAVSIVLLGHGAGMNAPEGH
jgi:hypothetical protein